jgi:hypothetical protein
VWSLRINFGSLCCTNTQTYIYIYIKYVTNLDFSYVNISLCVNNAPKSLSHAQRRRDSSVSIVIRLRVGRSGFNYRQVQWWEEFFLFTTASRPALGPTQPPIQRILRPLTPGVKRPGREANHSPLPTADVKNEWRYTSTPPICLKGFVRN